MEGSNCLGVIGIGGNCPGGNCLGGNCPEGNWHRGELSGGPLAWEVIVQRGIIPWATRRGVIIRGAIFQAELSCSQNIHIEVYK